MRPKQFLPIITPLLLCSQTSLASLFGSDSSSSSSSSSSGSSNASAVSSEVAFLLTLQQAKITSMTCLISLVNMTTSPIGKCLGLTDFVQLVVGTDAAGQRLSSGQGQGQVQARAEPQGQGQVQGQGRTHAEDYDRKQNHDRRRVEIRADATASTSPSSSPQAQGQAQSQASFGSRLSTYLATVCQTQCAERDIQDAQAELAAKCGSDGVKDTELVKVMGAVLGGYVSSYRTLACMVHYNGTSDLCLPATINSSTATNTNTFFNDLVSGSDLQQYTDSVWKAAECSGCMYDMFKSAQYTTPSIRNSPITQQLGNHLQNDCPGKNALPINWSDVQDQMIPDALEVGQNQNAQGGKGSSGSAGRVGDWRMGWGEVMGVLGVVVIGFGRRF